MSMPPIVTAIPAVCASPRLSFRIKNDRIAASTGERVRISSVLPGPIATKP